MNDQRCARRWEAAAIEDGRLVGAERASFERHIDSCRTCAEEVIALATPRRTMQGVLPSALTALDVRRMRQALLRQAHSRHPRHEGPRRLPILVAVTVAAVGVLAVLGANLHRVRSPRPVPLQAQAAATLTGPTFSSENVKGAVVTSRTEGGLTQALLSDGTAAFHVEHVASGHRFLLALPDGEIEVRGTRFVVSVELQRTRSVEVSEGVVALRLEGEGERLLGAGERWVAPPAAETVADARVGDALPRTLRGAPPGIAMNRRTAPPDPSAQRAALAADGARRSDASGEPPAASDVHSAPRSRFAAAVDSFQEARYTAADSILLSFMRDFPLDARCEDAAFLRAVAHSRMGDAAGAADLARAYLTSFPNGLRRIEAADLAERKAR